MNNPLYWTDPYGLTETTAGHLVRGGSRFGGLFGIPIGIILGELIDNQPEGIGSTSIPIGAASSGLLDDDDDVIPFPPDAVADPDKTGPAAPAIPIPGDVKQICPLTAQTDVSCFYICPDGSEIFLIKGIDPQCGKGEDCPPVQVK